MRLSTEEEADESEIFNLCTTKVMTMVTMISIMTMMMVMMMMIMIMENAIPITTHCDTISRLLPVSHKHLSADLGIDLSIICGHHRHFLIFY